MVLFPDDTLDNYITTKRTYTSSEFVDPILSNLHEFQTQILRNPELFEMKQTKERTGPRPLS